jgi:CDP-diacylglycerol--serine O-phosphatidyltransferase
MNSTYFLILLIILISYLLVARIELMAFKFKNFSWQDNKLKYSFMIISLALVFLLNIVAIPLVIVLYILISLFKKSLSSGAAKSS